MSKLFLIVALSLLSINGVISFDDNGPGGAIIILLGVVAFICWLGITGKDTVIAWLERRKAIAEAKKAVTDAEEELRKAKRKEREARRALSAAPGDAALQSALAAAKDAVDATRDTLEDAEADLADLKGK